MYVFILFGYTLLYRERKNNAVERNRTVTLRDTYMKYFFDWLVVCIALGIYTTETLILHTILNINQYEHKGKRDRYMNMILYMLLNENDKDGHGISLCLTFACHI